MRLCVSDTLLILLGMLNLQDLKMMDHKKQ